jgi:hypothetical protein
MLICAVSLANPAITDSLFVVGPSENPSSTVHIRNQVAVESASFSAGTPRGWIDISLFQTATKACYITNSQYKNPSDIVYAGGTVAINGHQFVVSATDTVQDVINMINDDSSLGVTAQLSGSFVALYQNNFGSDHLIAYAETDDILNGCNLAVQWGTDAKAVVTYADGTVEVYDAGDGLQLVSSATGNTINLTLAGNWMYGDKADAICIAPANLIGCRESVTAYIVISDDLPITQVVCTDPGATILSPGVDRPTVMFTSASTPGSHDLTFRVTDSAGVHSVTATYTTVPSFGIGLGSIRDSIMTTAARRNLFTVCGQLTRTGDSFYIVNGLDKQIEVLGLGSDVADGDYVVVRGQLDVGRSPLVLLAHSTSKSE